MSLTPKELLHKLVMQSGPCMRMCSYCPEEYSTREVKECVEGMIREIYALRSDKDEMLKDLIKIRAAYKEATGHEYSD